MVPRNTTTTTTTTINRTTTECGGTKAGICRRSMGREHEVRKTAENSTDDSRYKNSRKCCSTSSNTVQRAELGMYPPRTSRDVKTLKWQYKIRNMPKKRLPAMVDRPVWEKVVCARAGIG